MNIEPILIKFEENQSVITKARNSERESVRVERLRCAEAFQNKIKTVIEPVMDDVCKQLLDRGYPCEVVSENRKDKQFPESKTECAIAIRIGTDKRKDGEVSSNTLKYIGDFGSHEVTRETIIANIKAKDGCEPVAIHLLDKGVIESDVREFLNKVFNAY